MVSRGFEQRPEGTFRLERHMNQNDIVRANAGDQKVSFESCVKVATDQSAEIPYFATSGFVQVSDLPPCPLCGRYQGMSGRIADIAFRP